MERKKGWKAERLENKHIRKRKLAEGDKIQTGKKKNLPKDLLIKIKDERETINQDLWLQRGNS